MKLLLDTHMLLWAAGDAKRLPKAARRLISDAGSELFFSVVSLWEITIKQGAGRSDFQVDARTLGRGLRGAGYLELAITSEHVLAVRDLLPLHRDPFDRLLVAQARVEGLTFLTADKVLGGYGAPVRLV